VIEAHVDDDQTVGVAVDRVGEREGRAGSAAAACPSRTAVVEGDGGRAAQNQRGGERCERHLADQSIQRIRIVGVRSGRAVCVPSDRRQAVRSITDTIYDIREGTSTFLFLDRIHEARRVEEIQYL